MFSSCYKAIKHNSLNIMVTPFSGKVVPLWGSPKAEYIGKQDVVALFRRDTMQRASNAKEALKLCERPQKINSNNCRSPRNERDKKTANQSYQIHNERTTEYLREVRTPYRRYRLSMWWLGPMRDREYNVDKKAAYMCCKIIWPGKSLRIFHLYSKS